MGLVSEGVSGDWETATDNGLVEAWINKPQRIEINLHKKLRIRVYRLEDRKETEEEKAAAEERNRLLKASVAAGGGDKAE